jgi:hypothetical protein
MTVEAVQSDGTLRCTWFHEDGKQDNGFLHKSRFALPKRRIESRRLKLLVLASFPLA